MPALTPLTPIGSSPGLAITNAVAAGSTLVENFLLVSHANPAFKIFGDGDMSWGPGGASALDTTLQRIGVGQIQLTGEIRSARASAANDAFAAVVTGDSVVRFAIDADGAHSWGPGDGALDTILKRISAGVLQTDIIRFVRSTANFATLQTRLATGDTQDRFYIEVSGKQWWGDGSSTQDTNLYRNGPNILATDDEFRVGGATGNFIVLTQGFQHFPEITAPGNASANACRLFCEDNGAGKTRLAVIFPSGVKQIIATEP